LKHSSIRRFVIAMVSVGLACLVVAILVMSWGSRQDPGTRADRGTADRGEAERTESGEAPRPAAPESEEWTFVGRALGEDGLPVLDVVVNSADLVARTDHHGRFRIGPSRETTVRLTAPGYETVETHTEAASGDDVVDLGDIVLVGTGSVRVLVRARDGRPVSGAKVAWSRARSGYALLNPRLNPVPTSFFWARGGTTDATGSVTLRRVRVVGAVTVRAILPAGLTGPVLAGPFSASRIAEGPVVIEIPDMHILAVEARYADGKPMGDVIEVRKQDGDPYLRWTDEVPGNGSFEIALVPGVYEVRMYVEGRYLVRKTVRLDSDRRVVLALSRLVLLKVRVVDRQSRLPVPSFEVAIARKPHSRMPAIPESTMCSNSLVHLRWIRGQEDGQVTIRLPLPEPHNPQGNMNQEPARNLLLVRAPGYEADSVVCPELPEDEDPPVTEIALTPGVVLRGRVEGLRSARIRLYWTAGTDGGRWRAKVAPLADEQSLDEAGAVRLRGFGAGSYEVRALVFGRECVLGVVEAPAGGEFHFVYRPATVRVELPAGGDSAPSLYPVETTQGFAGPPRMHRGDPIRGVWQESRLVFDDVPAGSYLLEDDCFRAECGVSAGSQRVEVEPGGTYDLEWHPLVSSRGWLRLELRGLETTRPEDVLVAVFPASQAPAYAMNLSWHRVDRPIAVPAGVDCRFAIGTPGTASAIPGAVDLCAFAAGEVRVRPGTVETVSVSLEDPCLLRVDVDATRPLRLEVDHSRISSVIRPRTWHLSESAQLAVAPGRFSVRVRTFDGKSVSRTLEGKPGEILTVDYR
jgi:hypothetical protein